MNGVILLAAGVRSVKRNRSVLLAGSKAGFEHPPLHSRPTANSFRSVPDTWVDGNELPLILSRGCQWRSGNAVRNQGSRGRSAWITVTELRSL